MSELYFSVPYGTREMSFGITEDGGELWNFYLILIESEIMKSCQVIVYGDYNEDGVPVEMRSDVYERYKDCDNEFELEFEISESKKVKIYLHISENQYNICVNY